MSIQSALQAGVSGLGAQSRRFAAIADNISNAQTAGYKRSVVEFTTRVVDATARSATYDTGYAAGGVATLVNREIDRAGSIQSTSRSTDLAINGSGFFVVRGGTPANQADEPLLLTRVGGSALDAEGYLRLDSGYYLQGVPLDKDGKMVSQVPQSIQFDWQPSSPKPSQNITFKDNLPASLASQAVQGEPLETAVTYVDELGATKTLQFVWTPSAGGVPNSWNLAIYDIDADPARTAPLYDQNIAFEATGANAGLPGAIPGADADGKITLTTATGQTMRLDLQITQFDFTYAPTFSTDGVTASDFSHIDVDEDGTVYAVFKNGAREPRFKLMMADVANPSGLEPLDGNAYAITQNSGPLLRRFAGDSGIGTIRSYAVEGSNVDIADELTSMITTQRAYSANASIVTTSDQMLQELTNLKR
ncbi:flagellar hook protein FlgE [Benzoatithermus flavus]|uniref:Flagellar hook protein FlgE n=1 Tax=Benzoatithermus flavus TaxID=3108223 RepID=A0ABU8XUT9_9PROT